MNTMCLENSLNPHRPLAVLVAKDGEEVMKRYEGEKYTRREISKRFLFSLQQAE